MQIIFKKSFVKQYRKLQRVDRAKIDKALLIFEKNPSHPKLKNHALIGKLVGRGSKIFMENFAFLH